MSEERGGDNNITQVELGKGIFNLSKRFNIIFLCPGKAIAHTHTA